MKLEETSQSSCYRLWLMEWKEVSRIERNHACIWHERGRAQGEGLWNRDVLRAMKNQRRHGEFGKEPGHLGEDGSGLAPPEHPHERPRARKT